jgi:hypothetical protein
MTTAGMTAEEIDEFEFGTYDALDCEASYNKGLKICRRVRSMRGKAICYATTMAIYASCLALES